MTKITKNIDLPGTMGKSLWISGILLTILGAAGAIFPEKNVVGY